MNLFELKPNQIVLSAMITIPKNFIKGYVLENIEGCEIKSFCNNPKELVFIIYDIVAPEPNIKIRTLNEIIEVKGDDLYHFYLGCVKRMALPVIYVDNHYTVDVKDLYCNKEEIHGNVNAPCEATV